MNTGNFGDLLRTHRLAAGFSQEFLAAEAGISAESVGAIERGLRRAPYRDTVSALAKALRLSDQQRFDFAAAAERARARGSQQNDETPISAKSTLPVPVTSFIGREMEIAAISNLIERNRLVTITGSGGVGKTRTVIEVAKRLGIDRWESIRFVDLSQLTGGNLIVGAIDPCIEQLPHAGSTAPIDALIAALKKRRMLIVLDTCEHLIADAAHIVSAITASCAGVSVLATSREKLAIAGEQVYRLPSLQCPLQVPDNISAARQYPGIELFLDRAAASDASLALPDSSISLIIEICRQLDGIPLAIELAAARASTLGLESLLTRLRSGLSLAVETRNVPARQRTVHATISWSYELLDQRERALLERLSSFSGGFTLAAAESVCAGDGIEADAVVDVLTSLVDKSLVHVVPAGNVVRYRLLDSMRAFAEEQLAESGQTATLAKRHALWLADFADWIDSNRAGMHEIQLRALAHPELDNARVAINRAFASPDSDSIPLAARILGGLRTVWLTTGRMSECKALAERLFASIDEVNDATIAARLLRALIQTTTDDEMMSYADRAVPIFERIGDNAGIALLLSHLSRSYRRHGRMDEAESVLQRASEIFASLGNPRLYPYGVFLRDRAAYHRERGQFSLALDDIAASEAIMKSLGDDQAMYSRITRSQVFCAMGKIDDAVRLIEDVLRDAATKPTALEREVLQAHACLAAYHMERGDVAGAHAEAREVLILARDRDDLRNVSTALAIIGRIFAPLGNPSFGARCLAVGESVFKRSYVEFEGRNDFEKRLHRLLFDTLNDLLSPDEIDVYREQGRVLPLAQMIAEALTFREFTADSESQRTTSLSR